MSITTDRQKEQACIFIYILIIYHLNLRQGTINAQIMVMKVIVMKHPYCGRRWMEGWIVSACTVISVSNVSKLTHHLFWELTGTGTPQRGFHSLIPEWMKSWSTVLWWRCSYLQSRPGHRGSREGTSDWMNSFEIFPEIKSEWSKI